MKHLPRLFPVLALPLSALVVAACGGGSGSPTDPTPPIITISGVADQATYTSPVIITIAVSRGTYEATLNGDEVFSGHTVSDPDEYVLRVTARDGSATATKTVSFSMVLDGDSFLTIRLLDLGDNDSGGGGDAILVSDSAANVIRHVLVDAGPAGANGSDRGYVARRLGDLGVTALEALILSHAHGDHYLGIDDVYDDIEVGTFFYNGQVRNLASYNTTVGIATAQSDASVIPSQPVEFKLIPGGETTMTVVPPLGSYLANSGADSREINEGSVGARLERGDFSMFFTGDGEVEANQNWRTAFSSLTADLDVLKVGHHGANDAVFDNGFSGASTWLDHTDPDVKVISANGTTHPRINALNRLLSQSNTRTFCTNVHGEITIRVNPAGTYEVSVEKNEGMDCVPGSEATS